MKPRLTLPLLVLFLLNLASAKAQIPAFTPYSFLPKHKQLKVNAMHQDRSSFFWFATDQGVFKFDGFEAKQITDFDSTASIEVTAVAQSKTGEIWIGHKSGHLSKIVNDVPLLFNPEEGNTQLEISDIVFDHAGNMWYSTGGEGVYYYKNERLYNIAEDEGLPDANISDLEVSSTGRVWMGTDGGAAWCEWRGDSVAVGYLDYEAGLPDNIIKTILCADNGLLFFGTDEAGVVYYDSNTDKLVYPFIPGDWNLGPVTGLTISDNQLWIGTQRRGVAVYDLDKKVLKGYRAVANTIRGGIRSIRSDKEGNIWIAGKEGVFRSYGDYVLTMSNLEEPNVSDLAIDTMGNFWLITDRGVYHYYEGRNGRMRFERPFDGTPYEDWVFISIFADKNGSIWAGSYGNGVVCRLADGTLIEIGTDQLFNGNILDISGCANEVWLATLGGATKLTIGEDHKVTEMKTYNAENGVGNNYIYSVFVDSKKRVWFGTDGQGVSCLHLDGSVLTIGEEQGLTGKVVYSIKEDGKGNIWVNTKEAGLFRLNGERFESMGVEQGFRDENIDVLANDAQGNIVAMHVGGADYYNVETGKVTLSNRSESLSDWSPNLSAFAHDAFGRLWVGTNQGLVAYSKFLFAESKPLPFVTQMKVYDKAVDFKEGLELAHNQNNVAIDYLAFWYQAPNEVSYRLKLTPYDEDWIQTKNQNTVYSKLPPGDYTFELEAGLNGDFSHAKRTSFAFIVQKPFWEEPWFIVGGISVIVLLVVIFIRSRLKKLQRDKRILESKVEQRTEEIRNKNHELEAQHNQIQQANEEITAKSESLLEAYEEITTKSESLQAAYSEIEEQNESITQSIEYAQRIQNAILPLETQFERNFEQHFIVFRPRDIVSGDFYWLNKSGDNVYFAAVDCTGHGVPGALMSMIGYSIMNEVVALHPDICPAELLTKLHNGIGKALKQRDDEVDERNRQNDGMDVSLCRYNQKTKTLTYSGANRPLYVSRNGEMSVVKGNRASIGGRVILAKNQKSDADRFTNVDVPVEEGTWIYLFSDGYPDQFGGPEKRKFMTKRLRNLIQNVSSQKCMEQKDQLENALDDWMSETHQTDDILLMGVKF